MTSSAKQTPGHLLQQLIGKPVIVEGIKDRRSLQKLGFSDIIQYHQGKDIHEFCDSVAKSHKEIIVLTDFDTAGKKLAHKLTTLLEAKHVKVLRQHRLALKRIFEKPHVESWHKYMLGQNIKQV